MTYREKLIKNLRVKLTKIIDEYDELYSILQVLEGQPEQVDESPEHKAEEPKAVEPSSSEPTKNKTVYVTLYRDSTQVFNDTPVLHINRNKDIVAQVRDVKKNGFDVIVRDDSRTPEDLDILSKFANYLKLPLEK